MDEKCKSPVATEVAKGVRGPASKRKKAYYRAEKRGDLLFPGLTDFLMKRMMNSMTKKYASLFLDDVLKPSTFVGLLDICAEKNAPPGPAHTNWQSVYGSIRFGEKE